MPSITAYVTKFDYGFGGEANVRPGVFFTAPANLEATRNAGRVVTVLVSEGITTESFISGVREVERQIALSPFDDVIGEVIINSAE